MILVTGAVVAKPEHLAEVLELSLEHVRRSRAEAGCVLHSVHQDVEDPNRLVFLEHWADQDALDAHFRVPAATEFVRAVSRLAASPPTIEMYTVGDAGLHARREAIVREHMESENRHDFDATMATFARPRYELIGTGQVHDGEAEVRDYFRASRTAFPDQRNELLALHHLPDGILTEFDLLGTHLGDLAGIAPTGREFRCRMAALFLFEGDGLVCERVYFDSGTILRQLTA
jgi:quinol monooxygenase YgiN/predicted ester cyclase